MDLLKLGFMLVTAMVVAMPAQAGWRETSAALVVGSKSVPARMNDMKLDCEVKVRVSVDLNGLITGYDILKPCRSIFLMREVETIMMRVGQVSPPPTRKPEKFDVILNWQ